jgi:multidrug resistance efflux pump
MALLIREISYGPVLEPFEIVEGDAYFTKHAEAVLKCLGPVRTFCCIAGLHYLKNGERAAKGFYAPVEGAAAAVDPLPEGKAVELLVKKLNDELITVGSLMLRDDTKATQLAQLRAVKAEKELKDAQLKWAKVQERMNEAAVRAKKKAAEEAAGAAGKADQAKLEKVEKERDEAEAACKKALAELKAAKDKLKEVEDCGGATPESLQAIKDSYARHTAEQVQHEVSEIVRPWLVKLIKAEAQQAELERLDKVTTELLEKTKAAVLEQDILQRWELNRERALPALGRQLEELDRLMAMVLTPSPELVRAHATLREEVMKCRQALNPSEALGGVTTAMMAGVRSAPDEALPGLVSAIEKLVDAKVIDGKEGDALRRFIAGEKSLRSDKKAVKTSTRQKLSSALHAGKPVDIFVDAYNFMHTVHQHFQKLQMESKFNKGKFSFGPEARAHLAKLVSQVYPLDEHARVLLFLDGANYEDISPFKGVKFVLPTIMRTGEGQADAEIIHYLAHKARKEALVVVVSNDSQVQTAANLHLSCGEFARFLEDLG